MTSPDTIAPRTPPLFFLHPIPDEDEGQVDRTFLPYPPSQPTGNSRETHPEMNRKYSGEQGSDGVDIFVKYDSTSTWEEGTTFRKRNREPATAKRSLSDKPTREGSHKCPTGFSRSPPQNFLSNSASERTSNGGLGNEVEKTLPNNPAKDRKFFCIPDSPGLPELAEPAVKNDITLVNKQCN
jgi:hypothetical protein